MALIVPRHVESRLPPRNYRKAPAWLPSIPSLAFIAVLGVVLLLQSLAIEPGRIGSLKTMGLAQIVSTDAPLDQAADGLTQTVLGEQASGHSTTNFAPLSGVGVFSGHAAPALGMLELRSDEALRAALAATPTSTPVASSRTPEPTASPAPSPTPTPEPPSFMDGCEEHGSLYCVYEVKPGETLATIASAAGLKSTEDVAAHDLLVHSNLAALESAADVLAAGEKLRIPLEQGILHTVISSETLGEIARRYGVKPEAITAVAGNAISDGDLVSAGAELLVPNPTKLGRLSAPSGQTGSSGGSGALSWPAIGGITSYFGPAHPLGIDIAMMPGDPVNAAGDGIVTFSGGDPCCSYGYFIIIDHGNGLHTLYGHLSVRYVDEGDVVDAGDRIGLAGYTGFGTGPHLHFEVHDDDMLADPLSYLP